MRVVIAGGGTGGHLMPALALAEAFTTIRRECEPIIVGARRGVDAEILPKRRFRYYLIPAEPVYRTRWWRNLRWPVVSVRVWRAARDILEEVQPALVIGTGGYVAGPVLAAAARLGIPYALQEQNAFPGLTTRLLARWARQIHLGFPEACTRIHPGPQTAVFTLGNPIAVPPGADGRRAARERLGLAPEWPVLLVMGGSQGARAINRAVAEALEDGLLGEVAVLWSVGPSMFSAYRKLDHPPRCHVRPFWDPIGEAYAAADLAVARSGAMTAAELCAFGLPSILIPYPHAAHDHQYHNAASLAASGAAVLLEESGLSGSRLSREVLDIIRNRGRLARMAELARSRGNPKAAEEIVKQLLALVS